MIILAIKSFFFSRVDSYSLRRKPYTSHFFLLFCRKIIRIIYAILVIAIKDLEICLRNSILPLGKSAIWLKLLAHKGEIGKQMAGA